MDLRSLNTFMQVAELSSFTKAAEKLGFSQPTVSFQIKQLEEELGIRLFDRIGHTVSLTEGGRQALDYAQYICRMTQEMKSVGSKEQEAKEVIRLAMADSLCTALVIDEFAAFRAQHPNISLSITTAGTDELFRLLEHNEADIVCTLDNHIYNTTYVMVNEEKVGAHFICSCDDELAKKEEVTIDDLIKRPFLLTEKGMSYRRMMDERLAELSIEVDPALEIGRADLICRLVEEGAGISFLPDYVTCESVKNGKAVRLNVKDLNVELWKQILYHRNKWVSAQMQSVIDDLSRIKLG